MTVISIPVARLRALRRRFGDDERGVVSIVAALFLLVGLGLSALVLDAGHLYLAKRRLQAAVDAAALAGAGNLSNVGPVVAAALTLSGYSSDATVESGDYSADPSLAVDARFDPAGRQVNAVRVTKAITTPTILAGAIGAAPLSRITATATAARIPMVSFAAGTGLADISNGALNQVLGGLLGASLSLSLANYQALAVANVDALTFLNQLAIQASVTAGTYGDLANSSVTLGQMMAAARAALDIHSGGSDAAAVDALNLIGLQAPAAATVPLGKVVDATLWQSRRIGTIVQQTPGQGFLNLFDMFAAAARVYGAGHVVTSASALSLPLAGTGVVTRLAVGSPMASIALGKVGSTVSTAQTRLAMTITAADIDLGVARVMVSLPVYLQLASGQARVAAISCMAGGAMVRLSAASQAGLAQLGTVGNGALADFTADPAPGPVTVASVSILGIPVTISAAAAIPIAAGVPADQDFTQAEIDAGTVQTVAGSDSGHVFSQLAGKLSVSAAFSGGVLAGAINTTLNATVVPLLKATLVWLLTALDPAADTLLRSLGLRLGAMDTVVRGVRCGVPTLVR